MALFCRRLSNFKPFIEGFLLPACLTCLTFCGGREAVLAAPTLSQTFSNPQAGGTTVDNFGGSRDAIDISGDFLIVGANTEESGVVIDAGVAYLYNAVSGGSPLTIGNPSPAGSERFGWSTAIDGGRILVGSLKAAETVSGTPRGAAYVFDTSGALTQTLLDPTPVDITDAFGYSVSISGNIAAVSERIGGPTASSNAGQVHTFDATTGAVLQTIDNPNPSNINFGWSIAIDGDKLLVGHPDFSSRRGAAYLFDAMSGTLLNTFNNPDANASDRFGHAVAIDGDNVLIGARTDDVTGGSGVNQGQAFLFDATAAPGAAPVHTFNLGADAAGSDDFGYAVDLAGNLALIGAQQQDEGASNAGGRLLFRSYHRRFGLPRSRQSRNTADQ